jgi:limonene-1,2-epoxide hydrolase
LRVSDGKIVAGRDYYNVADLMQQLGLMPEPAVATA